MATGVAVQRKTYSGSGTARSVWQRNETDDQLTVSSDGYYKFADIATAQIGDIIEIIGPDYFIQREITAQNADGSWVTGDYGGSGGGASLTPDQLAQIAKQKTQTPNVGDPVAIGQIVIGPDQKQWENTSGAATTMPATFDPVPAGWTEYTGTEPEVIISAGPLVGAAPAGAKTGIDTTNDVIYKVDGGGNWLALDIASTELWVDTAVATTAEADQRWTLKPNHVIDATGLAVGEEFEFRTIAGDDHSAPNEGEIDEGALAWVGGNPPTGTLGADNYFTVIRESATTLSWHLDGTVSITNSGGGTPSTLDLAALITN